MQEPFDIIADKKHYAVFPEGNDMYTIFKEGKEYLQIQKDQGSVWLKLDYKTELPLFDEDPEIDAIGKAIDAFVPEEEEEEEQNRQMDKDKRQK